MLRDICYPCNNDEPLSKPLSPWTFSTESIKSVQFLPVSHLHDTPLLKNDYPSKTEIIFFYKLSKLTRLTVVIQSYWDNPLEHKNERVGMTLINLSTHT